MSVLESNDEWHHRQELQDYAFASPLGRFWINFWRRRDGEPPLRIREVRAELKDMRRRYEARLAASP